MRADTVAIDAALLRGWSLPEPGEGGKDERGRVLIVAGSASVPGAARLCGESALRVGAGKLQIVTVREMVPHVALAVPEALVAGIDAGRGGGPSRRGAADVIERARGSDAVVLGPGFFDDDETSAFVDAVVRELDIPVVLDAGALGWCRGRREPPVRLRDRLVLTPHPGEMAMLRGCARDDVEADPQQCARETAATLRAVVALKGATTFVTDASGELYRNDGGDAGLATSGSGDVLAGAIGGLLARGVAPLPAVCWGIYLHAQAGAALSQRIGLGFLAREIAAEIPPLMRALQRGGSDGYVPVSESMSNTSSIAAPFQR